MDKSTSEVEGLLQWKDFYYVTHTLYFLLSLYYEPRLWSSSDLMGQYPSIRVSCRHVQSMQQSDNVMSFSVTVICNVGQLHWALPSTFSAIHWYTAWHSMQYLYFRSVLYFFYTENKYGNQVFFVFFHKNITDCCLPLSHHRSQLGCRE